MELRVGRLLLPAPVLLDLSSCTTADAGTGAEVIPSDVKWILPQLPEALHLPNLSELRFGTDISSGLLDMFAVLSACPNILELCITTHGTSQSDGKETPIILLPRLTDLVLISRNKDTAHLILSHLSCPSLRAFAVFVRSSVDGPVEEGEGIITLQDLRVYITFFSRSGCPLVDLLLSYEVNAGAIPPEALLHLGIAPSNY